MQCYYFLAAADQLDWILTTSKFYPQHLSVYLFIILHFQRPVSVLTMLFYARTVEFAQCTVRGKYSTVYTVSRRTNFFFTVHCTVVPQQRVACSEKVINESWFIMIQYCMSSTDLYTYCTVQYILSRMQSSMYTMCSTSVHTVYFDHGGTPRTAITTDPDHLLCISLQTTRSLD